jgi:hypothetical protein
LIFILIKLLVLDLQHQWWVKMNVLRRLKLSLLPEYKLVLTKSVEGPTNKPLNHAKVSRMLLEQVFDIGSNYIYWEYKIKVNDILKACIEANHLVIHGDCYFISNDMIEACNNYSVIPIEQ